jgi:hypothetical protein
VIAAAISGTVFLVAFLPPLAPWGDVPSGIRPAVSLALIADIYLIRLSFVCFLAFACAAAGVAILRRALSDTLAASRRMGPPTIRRLLIAASILAGAYVAGDVTVTTLQLGTDWLASGEAGVFAWSDFPPGLADILGGVCRLCLFAGGVLLGVACLLGSFQQPGRNRVFSVAM